jgi:hypothetical protein
VRQPARRLTDQVKVATAAGALIALHIEQHIFARQMIGKCRAPWRVSGIGVGIVRRRRRVTGFGAGHIGVEVLESESQLIRIEAFGPTSELLSLKLLDDALETFDLVVAGLDDARHVAHQAVQKAHFGR